MYDVKNEMERANKVIPKRPTPQIVVTYPDGDGELWIYTKEHDILSHKSVEYSFIYSLKDGETQKEGLVRAARDIVNRLS